MKTTKTCSRHSDGYFMKRSVIKLNRGVPYRGFIGLPTHPPSLGSLLNDDFVVF